MGVKLTELKQRRMQTGLLQWQMARRCGLSEAVYCKYENGVFKIPEKVERRIDRVLSKYEVAAAVE